MNNHKVPYRFLKKDSLRLYKLRWYRISDYIWLLRTVFLRPRSLYTLIQADFREEQPLSHGSQVMLLMKFQPLRQLVACHLFFTGILTLFLTTLTFHVRIEGANHLGLFILGHVHLDLLPTALWLYLLQVVISLFILFTLTTSESSIIGGAVSGLYLGVAAALFISITSRNILHKIVPSIQSHDPFLLALSILLGFILSIPSLTRPAVRSWITLSFIFSMSYAFIADEPTNGLTLLLCLIHFLFFLQLPYFLIIFLMCRYITPEKGTSILQVETSWLPVPSLPNKLLQSLSLRDNINEHWLWVIRFPSQRWAIRKALILLWKSSPEQASQLLKRISSDATWQAPVTLEEDMILSRAKKPPSLQQILLFDLLNLSVDQPLRTRSIERISYYEERFMRKFKSIYPLCPPELEKLAQKYLQPFEAIASTDHL